MEKDSGAEHGVHGWGSMRHQVKQANAPKAWTTCTAAGLAHVAVRVQAMPLTRLLQSHVDQSITILVAVRSLPGEPLYLFIAMLAHLRAPVTSFRVSEAEASTATLLRRPKHSEAPTGLSIPVLHPRATFEGGQGPWSCLHREGG